MVKRYPDGGRSCLVYVFVILIVCFGAVDAHDCTRPATKRSFGEGADFKYYCGDGERVCDPRGEEPGCEVSF